MSSILYNDKLSQTTLWTASKKAQVSPSFTIIQFGLRENGEDFQGVAV